jgi:hypothetical protein
LPKLVSRILRRSSCAPVRWSQLREFPADKSALTIDLAEEAPRQVLAGIAQYYEPRS